MTDAPPPPASVAPPTDPPIPSPRRWDWRPKLRWFGAEYLIVVLGVLTAVGINAWWGHRADRATEAEYIEQIAADLGQNQALLDAAIATERAQLALAENVEAAMYQAAPPDIDSIRAWLGRRNEEMWWYSDPRLLDGTMTALVETGDLALLQDRHLRSSIVSYLGQLRSDSEEFRRFVQRGLDAEFVFMARGEDGLPPGLPPGAEREAQRFLVIRDDPAGRAAVEDLRSAYLNRVWYLEQMRAATDTLVADLASR